MFARVKIFLNHSHVEKRSEIVGIHEKMIKFAP